MQQRLTAPLAGLLFIACLCSSQAQSVETTTMSAAALAAKEAAALAAEAAAAAKALGVDAVVYFEVGQPELALTCALPGLAPDADVVWSKNGTQVEEQWDVRARWTAAGAALQLAGRAHEDDHGNYSCRAAPAPAPAYTVAVQARPIAKLPANSNVVEGQRLKLQCKLLGKPYTRVSWFFTTNMTETEGAGLGEDAVTALQELQVEAVLGVSEQGAPDGELSVEAAAKALQGRYSCRAGPRARAATTTLRVKDMYAALWPFLGIVLEVVVLCAVIAVYERRRTKPDLADSDTDTRDQKKS